MAFWGNNKKWEAINEKKASKKTRNSLINAYHVLREANIARERLERGRQEAVQTNEGMEGLPPLRNPEEKTPR